jgi:hypothetical protein
MMDQQKADDKRAAEARAADNKKKTADHKADDKKKAADHKADDKQIQRSLQVPVGYFVGQEPFRSVWPGPQPTQQ